MIVKYISEKEISGRARNALINSGLYNAKQIEAIKTGRFQSPAMRVAVQALKDLMTAYVDDDVLAVREILATSGVHRHTLNSGKFDNDPLFKITMEAYLAGQQSKVKPAMAPTGKTKENPVS